MIDQLSGPFLTHNVPGYSQISSSLLTITHSLSLAAITSGSSHL